MAEVSVQIPRINLIIAIKHRGNYLNLSRFLNWRLLLYCLTPDENREQMYGNFDFSININLCFIC